MRSSLYFPSSWFLSTIMFPPVVAVIPVFILAGKLQLFDTYPVLIIPYIAFNLPIVIWILRSTIFQLPGEIEEAALVDGCSRPGMIVRIVLPLIGSGMATSAILSIILCWNEFLFALSLTRSDVLTAPVGISEFTGGMFGTQWGPLTAASTLVLLPIIVMILILRGINCSPDSLTNLDSSRSRRPESVQHSRRSFRLPGS